MSNLTWFSLHTSQPENRQRKAAHNKKSDAAWKIWTPQKLEKYHLLGTYTLGKR